MVTTQQQGVASRKENQKNRMAGLLLAFDRHDRSSPLDETTDWLQLMKLLSEPGAACAGRPVQVELSVGRTIAEEDASQSTFRRRGDMWTLRFAGKTVYQRDSKGLRYLAHALANPREFLRVTGVFAAISGCHEALSDGSSKHQSRFL